MSDLVKNTRIALRRDYLSAWNKINPILLDGEIVIAVDEQEVETLKIGNGLSSFQQLPSFNEDGSFASLRQGRNAVASNTSYAGGLNTSTQAMYSEAHGVKVKTGSTDHFSYTWSGENAASFYKSHGIGTFNINPVNGLSGVWIGDNTLSGIIDDVKDYSDENLKNKIKIGGLDEELQTYDELSVIKLSYRQYENLKINNKVNPLIQYVISSEQIDTCGRTIIGLGTPTKANEAVNKSYVDSNFQKAGDYLESSEKTNILNSCIQSNELSLYFDNEQDDLILKYKKETIRIPAEIINKTLSTRVQQELDSKVQFATGDDDEFRPNGLSVWNLSKEKYDELSANNLLNEQTLYIISADVQDMGGMRITNLGDPENDDGDAVNVGYFNEKFDDKLSSRNEINLNGTIFRPCMLEGFLADGVTPFKIMTLSAEYTD